MRTPTDSGERSDVDIGISPYYYTDDEKKPEKYRRRESEFPIVGTERRRRTHNECKIM
jgi:hypothetical protein